MRSYKFGCKEVSSRFLKVFESVYEGTRDSVPVTRKRWDWFEASIGVRQGYLLSLVDASGF